MSRLTPAQQLQAWLEGDSRCPNTSDECCPDFSCCDPKLLAPRPEREEFVAASQHDREAMCMGFLGRLTETLGVDVHIAGSGPHE